MPRKRHDTSDEDSDVSIGDKRGKAKKSAPALNKKQRDSKASKRNVSESSSDTSPVKRKATDSKKGIGKRKQESESDSSPVKRSVQSRIHKPSDENRYVRPTSRENRSDARSISGSDASPDKRRKGPVGSPQGPRQRNDNIDRYRSRSPDLRQRSLDRFSRRDDRLDPFDDRNNYRGRNLDFDRRDRDMMIQPMDSRPMRDRSSDIRDRHFAFEDREREEYMDRSQHFGRRAEFDMRDRDMMREPLSPERGTRRNDRLSPERRRGRDRLDSFSYEQRNDFFERDPRLLRRQSLSPVRRNERQYQKSPRPISDSFGDARRRSRSFERGSRRQRNSQSLSPENLTGRNHFENNVSPDRLHKVENILDSKRSPEVKTKSGKSGKKKKNKKENEEKLSGPKSKGERQERSESLERSFERSKQSLIIPEDDGETQSKKNTNSKKEAKKSSKKNTSKRPRSSSGSPQRGKKSKENESSEPVQEKKGKKKGKKEKSTKLGTQASRSRSPSADSLTLKRSSKKRKSSTKPIKNSLSRRSHSRSNSPQERSIRSSGLDRSRSLDKSFGRKHDLTKFESEPESGEITDSDEEGKNALKSQVNKPLDEAEEKKQQEEDERYWNEKRRASRKREEELTKQPTSRSSKEDNRKENSGKRSRTSDEAKVNDQKVDSDTAPPAKKPRAEGTEILTGRTGGAYIPPARLRAMQASITDKSSVEYQRISWEALKKSINGLVNKVNVSNIENIVRELFQENIVRGRGLFARSIIQAQSASPTFTHVYAALVSIVNTKFPQNGELVLRRLIIQFRRGYKRNDKTICLSATRFVAHLVNQQVAHEVLSLEILTLLLEEPTDDSVEVAIGFLKECGQKLTDVSPRGINAIFERLRTILHESQIDKRVQYMIEVMFAVRKDQFKDYPALVEELDLVEEEDQFTHLLTLEDAGNGEELLNVFRPDPAFEENEEKYKILKKEILGEGSSDEEDGDASGGDDDDDDDSSEGDEEEDEEKKQTVIDNTETNMVALRRTIYLTIQSSLDFEECAHKLMKMDLKPGQEIELCNMILDCCAQMRTYEKFFGLLAGRFCMIDKKYVEPFQNMFKEQYDTIHRLETNKLRNVAKFFSHLLYTDSISWAVLSCIKLNEEDTTSASRIFIKILFQELSEYMGLPKLNERLKDPTLMEYFVGLMPRDNPRDTRFAINFFTTIGLGGLTDDLREHLKDVSKKLMQQKQEEEEKAAASEDSSDSSDSDTESSTGSSSDTDSSSDSESSEDDKARKRKQKESEKQKKKEKKKGKEGKERSSHQKEKQREKDVREKDKDKNAQMKVRKGKKGKKNQLSDVEQQKERDKQFKRLARLANYDEEIIDPNVRNKRSIDREDRVRKGQENGDRRDRRRNIDERDFDKGQRRNNDFDREEFDDDRYIHEREKGFDRDLYTERGFDRNYDSGYDREDRFDSIDKRRGGKRGKGHLDIDRHDPSIRVERNFERMDIYEEKFERDRARNLEFVRRRPEFEDYYEGRNEDSRMRGQDRDGRRREVEDPGFDARQYRDRTVKDDRHRNRSEERIPRDAGRRRR